MGCITSSSGGAHAAREKPGNAFALQQSPARPPNDAASAQPPLHPPPDGLTYDTFAEIAIAHLQGAATKQAAQLSPLAPSSPLASASMRQLRRSFMTDGDHNFRAWRRTATMLDRDRRGWVEWEDVEVAVRDLGAERDQAALIMDMLQTITRSKMRLRHIFVALDKDGGGTLSRAEWEDGIQLLLGNEEISQADRDKLWEVLDINGDGSVSYQEFMDGLSVEDTWGLHPNSNEEISEAEAEKKAKKEARHHALAPTTQGAHVMVDLSERKELAEDDPQRRAAMTIVRFLRRAKAHRLFENNIWQVTVRLLDLEDECELNTQDGGSSRDDSDSDDERDEPGGEVNAAVHELEVVVRDLVQRRLPPLPVAKAIIQAVTLLHQEGANVGYIKPPAEKSYRQGRVVIVGDLHGQLEDLLLIFDQCGLPSETNSTVYLFNGDFVDRGPYGVEVLLLLYTLKLLWPAKIFMNRGNHEAKRINEKYGFDEEVQSKYNQSIFKLMTKSFNAIPLCHVVYGSIVTLHGGLSEETGVTIADYNMINRFKQIPRKDEIPPGHTGRYDRLFEAAMWSDPRELSDGRATEPSKRGAGCHFGKPAVEEFMETNGLKRFIRSHEVYQPGYQDHHGRLTTTVFSASNYCGTDDNHGCYLVCLPPKTPDAEPEIHYMQYRVARDQMLELRDEVRLAVNKQRKLTISAKEDALRRLRALIFCRRTELMHYFQSRDSDKTGKVHLDIWVEAMKTYCTSGLPWRCIQKHLVPLEQDGMIPYVTFLERFQNKLARRWMEQWGKKMIRHMADRMLFVTRHCVSGGRPLSEGVEPSQDPLSYYQMCEALRTVLPGLSEAAIYYLMALCDQNKDGFIDVDEFATAVEEARIDDPGGCVPGVLDLWDLATFDPPGFQRLQKSFVLTVPSEQAKLMELQARKV